LYMLKKSILVAEFLTITIIPSLQASSQCPFFPR
jgi:hypothetical protein